ncbi:MAG: M36 family metallopeptidase [Casimicrobiaceae bacterium]
MNIGFRFAPRQAWAALVLALACVSTASARTLPPIDALASAPTASSAASPVAGISDPTLQVDARFGVPTFLWGNTASAALKSLQRTVSTKALLDEEGTARAHLRDVADLYQITAPEIAALQMHNLQRFGNGGAVVRFRNQVDGVEVFREQVNVLLDKSGGLAAIGGFAMGAPASLRKSAQVFTTTPQQALATALADYGFPAAIADSMQPAGENGGYTLLALPKDLASTDGSALADTARVKRVWFRLPSGLIAAWYVEVQVRDGNWPHDVDYYAYVVSAADGTVLFRRNQTADAAFSYRVYAESDGANLPLAGPQGRNGFPHPAGIPNGYQAPLVAPNLVTLQNAPFSKNDPWLLPGATRTLGNNVDAFSDGFSPDNFNPPAIDECNLSLPINGDLHACANSPAAFDYAYDMNQAPQVNRAQVMAAVTNLFYTINYLHDWYYDAGFDEAAGNAQTSNYGRGGVALDSIYAQTQDFTGTNNANMSTPADGQRPRMRQFLWSSSIALTKVNAPASIAGVKQSATAAFGPQSFDLTGDLVLALDAANPTGPTTTDGCTAFINAAGVAGKIAVIDRGVCLFVEKVKNAQNAGAVGVLILNNVSPGAPTMGGDDATITIPSVSVSLADGTAIKAALAQPATVSLRMARMAAPQRDGALDNTLIAHEWGHYISNRLVGNSNGLNANQANGMGEGWADFNAMLLLVKESDRGLAANTNFSGTYPVTAFPLAGPDFAPDVLNDAYYYGIRRYPYSRDMTKNPLTFKHITDGVPLPDSPAPSPSGSSSANSEVHNTGEVWASMLWECYSNLLNDTARLTFTQAQDRMKRYLVAGFKMTPNDPTFVTARDALLSVMQAQDAQDHDLCLQGFAKRGAGLGAVAPGPLSDDNSGVVESFKSTVDPGVKSTAIEYYHAVFDHYFVTNIADEITKLDNGTFKGWARTGESFNVYSDAPAGTAGVCRFFSTAFDPKSSHFYTALASECATVKQNPNWLFEAVVFNMPIPDGTGDCAAGTLPVYRLYNNSQGAAPNHRLTTSLATRAAMIAKGWSPEGDGVGVGMCSPQ